MFMVRSVLATRVRTDGGRRWFRAVRPLAGIALAALVAGCKGETTAPAPGTLHIAVSGAPSGATVVVTIQPKGQGTATTVSVPAGGANTTLPPGSYAVSGASLVDPSGDKYAQANAAETQSVAVTSGAVSNVTVTYAV